MLRAQRRPARGLRHRNMATWRRGGRHRRRVLRRDLSRKGLRCWEESRSLRALCQLLLNQLGSEIGSTSHQSAACVVPPVLPTHALLQRVEQLAQALGVIFLDELEGVLLSPRLSLPLFAGCALLWRHHLQLQEFVLCFEDVLVVHIRGLCCFDGLFERLLIGLVHGCMQVFVGRPPLAVLLPRQLTTRFFDHSLHRGDG
mmetsp:Transcript_49399/g.110897  ORF Transcript_49399/g.110897 Transcript_49399/m.110897 type:complete len:200 (+) Transcript_49399:657-1256(+)